MNHLRLIPGRLAAVPQAAKGPPEDPCLEAFSGEVDYLMRSLRRLGVHRDDLEDVAHDVFLVLYQSWEKYDRARSFRAYLFGVAFRVAANHVRKRRKEVPHPHLEITDAGDRPDQLMEAGQRRALAAQALATIPISKRAVLIMHDIDGVEMSEIASALSIYRFTGYSRLHQARKEFAAAVRALSGEGER